MSVLLVGDACTTENAAQCIYEICSDGACAQPSKQCPGSTNETCSGQGNCYFVDMDTSLVTEDCLVSDTFCSAQCNCTAGYYGVSCSLTMQELVYRSEVRGRTCRQLQLNVEDHSSSLLSSIATSLYSLLNKNELVQKPDLLNCTNLLEFALVLVSEGYLTTASEGTDYYLFETISNLMNIHRIYPDMVNMSSVFNYLHRLEYALQTQMVDGQNPTVISSSAYTIALLNTLAEDVANASISPPLSTEESYYGKKTSSIIFPSSGLSSCGFGSSEYVRLGARKFSVNPYRSSTSSNYTVGSQFSGISISKDIEASSSLSSLAADRSSVQPYFVVIQLSSMQSWESQLPTCGFVDDGVRGSCPCDIMSYSATNITFICRDVYSLCPNGVISTPHNYHPQIMLGSRRYDFRFAGDSSSRYTQTTKGSEYAGMFQQIGFNIVARFSDIGSINVAQNIPTLVFTGSICVVILFGLIYFKSWDKLDHDRIVYVHNKLSRSSARRKLPEFGAIGIWDWLQSSRRLWGKRLRRRKVLQSGQSVKKTELIAKKNGLMVENNRDQLNTFELNAVETGCNRLGQINGKDANNLIESCPEHRKDLDIHRRDTLTCGLPSIENEMVDSFFKEVFPLTKPVSG